MEESKKQSSPTAGTVSEGMFNFTIDQNLVATKEIKEVTTEKEVNKWIKEGWLLHKTICKDFQSDKMLFLLIRI